MKGGSQIRSAAELTSQEIGEHRSLSVKGELSRNNMMIHRGIEDFTPVVVVIRATFTSTKAATAKR